jgi:hypothetical protein
LIPQNPNSAISVILLKSAEQKNVENLVRQSLQINIIVPNNYAEMMRGYLCCQEANNKLTHHNEYVKAEFAL